MSFLSLSLVLFLSGCASKVSNSTSNVEASSIKSIEKESIHRWKGDLQLPTGELSLIVDFKMVEGKWSAVLHVPSQGVQPRPSSCPL